MIQNLILIIVLFFIILFFIWIRYKNRIKKIYIGFSYKDKKIKDTLADYLVEKGIAEKQIIFWNDDWIMQGWDFEKKIKKEIKYIKVAVLLISEGFLRSDASEIPVICNSKNLKVLVVPVSEDFRKENFKRLKKRFNFDRHRLDLLEKKTVTEPITKSEWLRRFLPFITVKHKINQKTLEEIADYVKNILKREER